MELDVDMAIVWIKYNSFPEDCSYNSNYSAANIQKQEHFKRRRKTKE